MAVAVNAYNLKQTINVLGVPQLMADRLKGLFQHKNKRPEHIGALVGAIARVSSYRLLNDPFLFIPNSLGQPGLDGRRAVPGLLGLLLR
jgi:hypothetical protein